MALIRCNKKTHLLLVAKKNMTGESMADLMEYAVVNMPYIPIKNVQNVKKTFKE